jgi:hypothetical protein
VRTELAEKRSLLLKAGDAITNLPPSSSSFYTTSFEVDIEMKTEIDDSGNDNDDDEIESIELDKEEEVKEVVDTL